MSAKKQKIPKFLVNPVESKIPKVGIVPSDHCCPDFKAEQMDKSGPWGWDFFDSAEIIMLFQKIFESQKLTWQSLRSNGSHFVNRTDLCSEAQKRLTYLRKDDLDQLFSLRLTGPKRVWGIKEGNILWLLWWDPKHRVCVSNKKHT